MRLMFLVLCTFFMFASQVFCGKILYVTDKIKITLRTGPSIQNKILRMLLSGTKLYPTGEVENGWIKVKTETGVEGWVLKKYTLTRPPASLKLKDCLQQTQKLTGVVKENKNLKNELSSLKKEYETLKNNFLELKNDAANIETLKNNYLTAKKELELLKSSVFKLEKENSYLRSRKNLYWFLIGALTVLFSFFVGFIIGRVQRRKNKSLYF